MCRNALPLKTPVLRGIVFCLSNPFPLSAKGRLKTPFGFSDGLLPFGRFQKRRSREGGSGLYTPKNQNFAAHKTATSHTIGGTSLARPHRSLMAA